MLFIVNSPYTADPTYNIAILIKEETSDKSTPPPLFTAPLLLCI